MRKQLSMKRIHMLAANHLISLGLSKGKLNKNAAEYTQAVVQPILMDFIKYVWEHKDDDNLYSLKKLKVSESEIVRRKLTN